MIKNTLIIVRKFCVLTNSHRVYNGHIIKCGPGRFHKFRRHQLSTGKNSKPPDNIAKCEAMIKYIFGTTNDKNAFTKSLNKDITVDKKSKRTEPAPSPILTAAANHKAILEQEKVGLKERIAFDEKVQKPETLGPFEKTPAEEVIVRASTAKPEEEELQQKVENVQEPSLVEPEKAEEAKLLSTAVKAEHDKNLPFEKRPTVSHVWALNETPHKDSDTVKLTKTLVSRHSVSVKKDKPSYTSTAEAKRAEPSIRNVPSVEAPVLSATKSQNVTRAETPVLSAAKQAEANATTGSNSKDEAKKEAICMAAKVKPANKSSDTTKEPTIEERSSYLQQLMKTYKEIIDYESATSKKSIDISTFDTKNEGAIRLASKPTERTSTATLYSMLASGCKGKDDINKLSKASERYSSLKATKPSLVEPEKDEEAKLLSTAVKAEDDKNVPFETRPTVSRAWALKETPRNDSDTVKLTRTLVSKHSICVKKDKPSFTSTAEAKRAEPSISTLDTKNEGVIRLASKPTERTYAETLYSMLTGSCKGKDDKSKLSEASENYSSLKATKKPDTASVVKTQESLKSAISNRLNEIGPMIPDYNLNINTPHTDRESEYRSSEGSCAPLLRIHELSNEVPTSQMGGSTASWANVYPRNLDSNQTAPQGYGQYGSSQEGGSRPWYASYQPSYQNTNQMNSNPQQPSSPYTNQWPYANYGYWPQQMNNSSQYNAYNNPSVTVGVWENVYNRAKTQWPQAYQNQQRQPATTQQPQSTPFLFPSWGNNPYSKGHVASVAMPAQTQTQTAAQKQDLSKGQHWGGYFSYPSQTTQQKNPDKPKTEGTTKCSTLSNFHKDQIQSGIKPIIIDPEIMPHVFEPKPNTKKVSSESSKDGLISTNELEEFGIKVKPVEEIVVLDQIAKEKEPIEEISFEREEKEKVDEIVKDSALETLRAKLEVKSKDIIEPVQIVKESEQILKQNEPVEALYLEQTVKNESDDSVIIMSEQNEKQNDPVEGVIVLEQTSKQKEPEDAISLTSEALENKTGDAEDPMKLVDPEPETTKAVRVKPSPAEQVLKPIFEDIKGSSSDNNSSRSNTDENNNLNPRPAGLDP